MRREGVRSLSIVGAAAETGLRGSVRHAAGPYALATPFAFSYVRKPPRPSMPASSVMSALRSGSGGGGRRGGGVGAAGAWVFRGVRGDGADEAKGGGRVSGPSR